MKKFNVYHEYAHGNRASRDLLCTVEADSGLVSKTKTGGAYRVKDEDKEWVTLEAVLEAAKDNLRGSQAFAAGDKIVFEEAT